MGGGDARSYKVTDQHGIKYYFVSQDRTRYDYSYGDPRLDRMNDSIYYASAWHLDEIEDLNGNKITYTYHKLAQRMTLDLGHSMYYKYWEPEVSYMHTSDVHSATSAIYHPKILDKIESQGITVSFHYIYEYYSTTQQPLISKIEISAPSEETRIIEFMYEDDPWFLSRIIENNETIMTFEYNDPGETYYSQDFGGYYNGVSNRSLIPSYGGIGRGADRSVNPKCATSGALTKITYPTGGSTELIWESNRMMYVGSKVYDGPILNQSTLETTTTDTLQMCVEEEAYRKLSIKNWRIRDFELVKIDLTKYLNMNPANLYGTDYHSTHHLETDYPRKNPPNYPHVVFIRKDETNGNETVEKVLFIDKETIEENGENQPITFYLRPGVYDITLVNPLSISNSLGFLGDNMRYHDSPAGRIYIYRAIYELQSNNSWCGLRIQRVKSSTGADDDDPLRTYYYYDLSANPHGVTGVVSATPLFWHKYFIYYCLHDGNVGYNFSDVTAIGEVGFPSTIHGSMSQIMYPNITTGLCKEHLDDPDSYLNYFKHTSSYSVPQNAEEEDFCETEFVNFQPVGARMYTSKAHYHGNILRKGIMGNTIINSHTTSYSYNIFENNNTPFLTTDAFTICDYTNVVGISRYSIPEYGIGRYHLIPYNKTVASENYVETDGLTVNKTYQYFFDVYTDNIDHNLPKSVTVENSDGNNTVTYYTYPLLGNSTFKHHFPSPETEVTISGNEVLSAKRNVYDQNGNLTQVFELKDAPASASMILSRGINSTKSQINLINSLAYEYLYDTRGNIIEIKYHGRPLASYIWGYNGLYPIIEAQNISYDTLKSLALSNGLTNEMLAGSKVSTQAVIDRVVTGMRESRSDVSFTSLSYHWLFGLVNISDTRGIKTSYEYDNRGRLTSSRDFNNFLINKFQYRYEWDYDDTDYNK